MFSYSVNDLEYFIFSLQSLEKGVNKGNSKGIYTPPSVFTVAIPHRLHDLVSALKSAQTEQCLNAVASFLCTMSVKFLMHPPGTFDYSNPPLMA